MLGARTNFDGVCDEQIRKGEQGVGLPRRVVAQVDAGFGLGVELKFDASWGLGFVLKTKQRNGQCALISFAMVTEGSIMRSRDIPSKPGIGCRGGRRLMLAAACRTAHPHIHSLAPPWIMLARAPFVTVWIARSAGSCHNIASGELS